VAWQNRIAWRVDNGNGTYWRTFDVFRTAGDQDFFETPFPKKFDAGEHIIQDERGAQFYHLSNGKGEVQDFANPFVVKGDPPARTTPCWSPASRASTATTPASCLPERAPDQLKAGVDLLALTPDRAERFRQFYLQERRMDKAGPKRDQEDYADFVRECNGLTPGRT
jgi:hypothetical protein